VPPSALDTLAASLAGTFPGCEDAPLATRLLRTLAHGDPVSLSSLDQGARAVVERWPNVKYDDHGRIVAFSGLSLTPTAHRFTVGGRALYTWCAWDTLFLPAMLDRPATVQSRCPITATDVRVTVVPDGIADSQPTDVGVSFPPPSATSAADITATFCCHVHFLAGPAAGEQWLGQHPGGVVLELDDAYELGRIATC
jgi:alkylmercury lyase